MTQTMKKNEFKHESIEDPQTIARYLEALRDGFAKGALRFRSEDRELVLDPQGLVNLVVEAKRKGDTTKLNLKFRWDEPAPAGPRRESLVIEPAGEG